jgi:drug/metabolite transporter (DMT)-like permease
MNEKIYPVIFALISVLLWASVATLSSFMIHLPPFYVLGISFLIGSLPAFFKVKKMFPHWKIILWGVTGYFGYHFCLFYSFRFAPVIEANLINYLWPVLMILLTPLFFVDHKLKIHHFIGAIISIMGCILLVLNNGAKETRTESLKGYTLALLAAIVWPLYSIVKKKMGEISVWSIGSFCFFTGLLCFTTHLVIEPRVVLQWHDFWKMVLLGLGPFGLAFYTWDLALKLGDSRVIGSLAYLTPALSTLGLIIFAGKEMMPSTFAAMILIILGASTGLLDIYSPKR